MLIVAILEFFYCTIQLGFLKNKDFRDVPDELWERVEPLLAPFKRQRNGGGIKPIPQLMPKYNLTKSCRMVLQNRSQMPLSADTAN